MVWMELLLMPRSSEALERKKAELGRERWERHVPMDQLANGKDRGQSLRLSPDRSDSSAPGLHSKGSDVASYNMCPCGQ